MAKERTPPVTKTISALTARTQFGQVIDLAKRRRARFVVQKNGQAAAVILGIEDYLETVLKTPAALAKIQAESRKRGLDLLSAEEIDAEVAAVRRESRRAGRK